MNQPPQTEKQAGKRIVSKGEYVKRQAERAVIGVSAYCSLLLALVCLGIAISYLLEFMNTYAHKFTYQNTILFLVFGASTVFFGKISVIGFRRAGEVKIDVPLTRANTADLPAPDSLVRASEEPVQEQQAVLLRAATETAERQEEQLVRATSINPSPSSSEHTG